ncbi:hypothetical protein ACLOJK_017868 [Asimina triloba]
MYLLVLLQNINLMARVQILVRTPADHADVFSPPLLTLAYGGDTASSRFSFFAGNRESERFEVEDFPRTVEVVNWGRRIDGELAQKQPRNSMLLL